MYMYLIEFIVNRGPANYFVILAGDDAFLRLAH
jgi:hypothetical protein